MGYGDAYLVESGVDGTYLYVGKDGGVARKVAKNYSNECTLFGFIRNRDGTGKSKDKLEIEKFNTMGVQPNKQIVEITEGILEKIVDKNFQSW